MMLFVATALAGSGPWLLGPGDQSVYTGVEVQRLTRLHVVTDGDGGDTVIDVGEGLSTFGVKGIVTYGLLARTELEIEVPWYRVQANRRDAQVCIDLGPRSCATTQSVGLLQVRAEGLLLDELAGSPISLSLGTHLRYGGFTAPTRKRVTNVGEGTTDLGLVLSAGRSGGLGAGYWLAYVEGGWTYRFPTTDSYPSNQVAPLPEWTVTGEALLAPDLRFALGPSATWVYRDGLDWYELDLADPDRFAALGVQNLRVGGKVIIRNDTNVAFSVGALRTVYAQNNPTDAWIINAGLSAQGLRR